MRLNTWKLQLESQKTVMGEQDWQRRVVADAADDKYVLHLVDLNMHKTIAKKENVTTAVFNIAEDAVVAGLDAQEDGLAILEIPTL